MGDDLLGKMLALQAWELEFRYPAALYIPNRQRGPPAIPASRNRSVTSQSNLDSKCVEPETLSAFIHCEGGWGRRLRSTSLMLYVHIHIHTQYISTYNHTQKHTLVYTWVPTHTGTCTHLHTYIPYTHAKNEFIKWLVEGKLFLKCWDGKGGGNQSLVFKSMHTKKK